MAEIDPRSLPPWLKVTDGALLIAIHVQPGASRTEWAGTHGDALKIRLKAPPVDGKANEALLGFIAETAGVARRAVELVGGQTSRRKRVAIAGVTADLLLERVPPSSAA